MSATTYSLMRRYEGQSLLLAFPDNESLADILQIENQGGQVIVSVSYNGTVNFNASGLTFTTGQGGAGLYTLNRQLDGKYRTVPGTTITTVAQAFAAAFPLNPQNQDIIQVINIGGSVGYYIDYTGVAHGS